LVIKIKKGRYLVLGSWLFSRLSKSKSVPFKILKKDGREAINTI